MKFGVIAAAALAAALGLSLPVHADEPAAQQKPMEGMPCPMMKGMDSMHKGMGDMMGDMDSMMQAMSDPAMKERMMKMHAHMQAMMQQMMEMQGGMMPGGNMGAESAKDAPAAPAAEDHQAHHPDK